MHGSVIFEYFYKFSEFITEDHEFDRKTDYCMKVEFIHNAFSNQIALLYNLQVIVSRRVIHLKHRRM